MIVEARRAARNERLQRARGGLEPERDVYRVMRFAYPGVFLAMIVEAIVSGAAVSRAWFLTGLAAFGLAKALKWWAITALGPDEDHLRSTPNVGLGRLPTFGEVLVDARLGSAATLTVQGADPAEAIQLIELARQLLSSLPDAARIRYTSKLEALLVQVTKEHISKPTDRSYAVM
jgi:hypothetical protein